MNEIQIDVPVGKATWPIDKVTFLKETDQGNGIKFYFANRAGYERMLKHLDIFSDSAEDSPSDERKFGYDPNAQEKSLLFTLDFSQALDLFKGYELISEESIIKILEVTGFKNPLEQLFDDSKVALPAKDKPQKQQWGCRDNMYKSEEEADQQRISSKNGFTSKFRLLNPK